MILEYIYLKITLSIQDKRVCGICSEPGYILYTIYCSSELII